MGEKRDRPDGKTRDSHQKKRKLKYSKCTFCRRDKKGCEPPDRVWPEQKCQRCEDKGFDCSASVTTKGEAASDPVVTNGAAHADAGASEGQVVQDLEECQTLSLKLSWIQRIETRIAGVQSLLGEDGWDLPESLESMIDACRYERSHIIGQISQLLRPDAPLVREAVYPLMPSAMGRVQTTNATRPPDFSPLESILESGTLSLKIDIELSVREYLLVDTYPWRLDHRLMGYRDACQRYMEQLEQIDNWQESILSPHGTSSPLSEARILSVMLRKPPETGFPGPDYFGRHFLQAAVEVCEERDIQFFIERMHAEDFINMVRHCCNDTGWSVLHIAAMRSMNCIFEKMLNLGHESFDSLINAKDWHGSTPLHYAMKSKGSRTARMIMRLGADPSIVDGQERNALHHAVDEGHQDLVQYLISSDASLHTAFNYDGWTPLHLAIQSGRFEIVQLFPLHSIRVPGAGITPLIMATLSRKINIMRWLLDRGMVGGVDHLDINGKNHVGDTALHLAASLGTLEAVELLVSKGANVEIPNEFGRTPRDCALLYAHSEVAAYLFDIAARSRRNDANSISMTAAEGQGTN